MNSGPLWPSVRTRWIMAGEYQKRLYPPAYCKIAASIGFIEDPADPLTITAVDVTPAYCRYSYHEGTARATWSNEWSDGGLFNGFLTLEQRVAPDKYYAQGRILCQLNYLGAIPYGNLFEYAFEWYGYWTNFGGFPVAGHGPFVPFVRWPLLYVDQLLPAGYADLFSAGIDNENTAPAHWYTD